MSDSRRKRDEKREELKTIRTGQDSKPSQPSQKERQRREELKAIRTAPSGAPTATPDIENENLFQAQQNIEAAKQTLEQAESLSESYGSTIQWGGKEYDLGTTEGWKEYRQALREYRSEVNEAENQAYLYEQRLKSIGFTGMANTVIEGANNVIAKANKIIKWSNETNKALYEAQKKLLWPSKVSNRLTRNGLEYYGDQLNETAIQLSDQLLEDTSSIEEAKTLFKAVSPNYVDSLEGENALDRLFKAIERQKRKAESQADWDRKTGRQTGERLTLGQLAARLEHLTLAAGESFLRALPFAGLAATGPIGTGMVVASTVATLADERNRFMSAAYIGAHPEEFYASIAGALAAGYSVAKVQQIWNKYNAQIKSTAIRNKMDKLIDDYAYLEQNRGAEFPSRAIEIPEDYGGQIIISEPINEEAQILERFMKGIAEGNEPEAIANYFKEMKDANMALYFDAGGGVLETATIPDLISRYPELAKPFIHPAFQDPSLLGKADLVARVSGSGIQMTPLLAAALAQAARQGYLTHGDVMNLIESNMGYMYELREFDLTVPWTYDDLAMLNIEDATLLVDAIPSEASDTLTMSAAEQALALEELQLMEQPEPLEPVPTLPIPEFPEPPTPVPSLPKFESAGQVHNYMLRGIGDLDTWRVTYEYPRGKPEVLEVKARGMVEALVKAQRQRQITKYLPDLVDIKEVK